MERRFYHKPLSNMYISLPQIWLMHVLYLSAILISAFVLAKHLVFKAWSYNCFLGTTFIFKKDCGMHKTPKYTQIAMLFSAWIVTMGILETAFPPIFIVIKTFFHKHLFNSCNYPFQQTAVLSGTHYTVFII